jgi:hypothetical protein
MAHDRAVSLLLRLVLVGFGLAGLYLVWVVISTTRSGSDFPYDLVLLAVALAGAVVGILWIRKIANEVGEV